MERPDHVVFFGRRDLWVAVYAGSRGLAFDQSHGFRGFCRLAVGGKGFDDRFVLGARWRQSLG